MIDFSAVKGLTIPEGVVTQIADASGRVLWSAVKHVSDYGHILDSWEDIGAGKYLRYYSIGNYKRFYLTDGTAIDMEIVAFNADECQDGTKASITWLQKSSVWSGQHNGTSAFPAYGWVSSAIRTRLQSGGDIYNAIPAEVMNVIKTVRKYDQYYYPGTSFVDTKFDKLWIPNYREIFGGTTFEHLGATYNSYFSTESSRIKLRYYYNNKVTWWLRTVNSTNDGFCCVNTSGALSAALPNATNYIVLGFCT